MVRLRPVSKDDALLEDFSRSTSQFGKKSPFKDHYEYLRQQGIHTYSQLYALAADDQTEPELRSQVVDALRLLHQHLDRRKVRPVVLKLARSDNDGLREAGLRMLAYYRGQDVDDLLLRVMGDQADPHRWAAIEALSYRHMETPVIEGFIRVIRDETDEVRTRAFALEYIPDFEGIVDLCIDCLRHSNPDMRFWAAYRLGAADHMEDIAPARDVLDQVVAYDHNLPNDWGWHIDREALMALETIYFQPHVQSPEFNFEGGRRPHMRLISPAAEYNAFVKQHRRGLEEGTPIKSDSTPIQLRLEPDWLQERIQEQWPDAKFNVREPRPTAYLLDWVIEIDGELVSGALHRDQYAVVISTRYNMNAREGFDIFASWYRGLIDPAVPLYLYEWADEAEALPVGVNADQLRKRVLHEI